MTAAMVPVTRFESARSEEYGILLDTNAPRARYALGLVQATAAYPVSQRTTWIACQLVRRIITRRDSEYRVLVEVFGEPTEADIAKAQQLYGPTVLA